MESWNVSGRKVVCLPNSICLFEFARFSIFCSLSLKIIRLLRKFLRYLFSQMFFLAFFSGSVVGPSNVENGDPSFGRLDDELSPVITIMCPLDENVHSL